MSRVSSVPNREKVPKKKRELLLLPLTAVIKITEEGPVSAQGSRGQRGLSKAGDVELRSQTFLSSSSASLWLCVTLGKLLTLN